MSVPVQPLLQGLPFPLLAALLYVITGLAYLAVSGAELPDRMRPDSNRGSALARATAMALVLVLVLLVWPAGPLLRARRSHPLRRLTMAWRSRAGAIRPGECVISGRQAPVEDAKAAGPRWVECTGVEAEFDFRAAAARLRVACEQERLIDAVFLASALVDDVTRRCGPDHPQVLDAMELLAHVAHLVGDQARSVRLYVHVASRRAWHFGIDYPGATTAVRNAYASWLAASDQAALRTGFLLVPCLRMVAGSTAPITRASVDRLQMLRETLGSGRESS